MVRQGMLVESGLHKFLGLYRALPKLLRDVGVDPHVLISWVDEFEIHVPETRFSGKLLTDRFDPSPLDAAINRRSCCCLPAASPGGSRWITWISCDSFRNSPGVLQSAFDGAKSAFILH